MTASEPASAQARDQRADHLSLFVGLLLMLVPLAFLAGWNDVQGAEHYLRVISALGGALAGASLPGFLHVELSFARAGGSLAIFVMIFALDPTGAALDAVDRASAESESQSASSEDPPADDEVFPAIAGKTVLPPSEVKLPTAVRQTRGWLYVGMRGDRGWNRTPALTVGDDLPSVGSTYRVASKAVVHTDRPRLPFYRLPDTVDALRPGQKVEVTRVSVIGRGRVWVRVRLASSRR